MAATAFLTSRVHVARARRAKARTARTHGALCVGLAGRPPTPKIARPRGSSPVPRRGRRGKRGVSPAASRGRYVTLTPWRAVYQGSTPIARAATLRPRFQLSLCPARCGCAVRCLRATNSPMLYRIHVTHGIKPIATWTSKDIGPCSTQASSEWRGSAQRQHKDQRSSAGCPGSGGSKPALEGSLPRIPYFCMHLQQCLYTVVELQGYLWQFKMLTPAPPSKGLRSRSNASIQLGVVS